MLTETENIVKRKSPDQTAEKIEVVDFRAEKKWQSSNIG
jgi:hypothetical protein